MSYVNIQPGRTLLKRAWRIVISTESSIGEGYAKAVEIANSELISPENPTGGLHFDFDIHKDLTAEPNKCSIKVYNLSQDIRNALDALSIFDPKKPRGQKKAGPRNRDKELYHRGGSSGTKPRAPKTGKILVEIHPGYVETGLSLIFRGDLRRASSEYQDDGSWCTEIEGEDGGRSTLSSRINESFAPGTSKLTVVKACADALGLGLGNIIEVQSQLNGSYPRGTACTGSAATELQGVLRGAGLTYSVHDGVMEFRPLSGPQKRTTAVYLSASSGLVGAPVRQSTGLVEVTSLLNPQISLGGYISLDAKDLSGDYFVQVIKYRGSNFSQDWYCEVELRGYE